MRVIELGTRKIAYNFHREDRKRLRIIVAPEFTLDVFAPAKADEGQIQAAIMNRPGSPANSMHLRSFTRCRHRKNTLAKKPSFISVGSTALRLNRLAVRRPS